MGFQFIHEINRPISELKHNGKLKSVDQHHFNLLNVLF